MYHEITAFIERQDKKVIFFSCLLIEAFIFWLDLITGPLVSFAPYYLIPICVAAWHIGRRSAYFFVLISALTRTHVFAPLFPRGAVWLYLYDILVNALIFLLFAVLIRQVRKLVDELFRQSRFDHLTGIYNRRYFYEAGAAELSRSRRYRYPLTVAYIDLDDFKEVNDTCGHGTGDRLLATIAGEMTRGLREGDTLGRLGGDEFGILLPYTDSAQAKPIIERTQRRLDDVIRSLNLSVTLSIGVVSCLSDKALSLDEVLAEADRGMYVAKRGCRGSVRFAEL